MMKRRRRNRAYVIAALVVMAAYIIAVVMIGCLVGLVAELVDSGYERDDFEPVVVIVHPGDTAWSFARQYCPKDVDYREYLDWCAAENGMDDMGNIQYGRSYLFLKLKNE